MKQKAQIFSLDMLISIVLIVVALGVAMRFFELKEYETNELMQQIELERVGNTASELLVNNPGIVCELTDIRDGTVLNSLSNCLNKNQQIKKSDLAIPDVIPGAFDCQIKFKFTDPATGTILEPIANGNCGTVVPSTAKNVFAATREIVLIYYDISDPADPKYSSRSVPKSEFNYCTDALDTTNCTVFVAGTASIKVWKS